MPVTISLPQIAAAVRVQDDPTEDVEEPWLNILARSLGAASAAVDLYAPDAPDVTANQAVTVMVQYLVDQPSVPRSSANAFTNSGAEALLAAFHGPSFAQA